MATPALKLKPEEPPVEDRIGKLEAHVEHIQADVADTKIEVRRLNDKLDDVNHTLSGKIDNVNYTLSAKIDAVYQASSAKTDAVFQMLLARIDDVNKTLSAKIDAIHQQLAELKISRALDRVWWLLMCGTLLGVMARGFKWI